MDLFRKTYLKAFLLGGIVMAGSSLSAVAGDQPKSVVELFTSQGCSSCPAADKILSGYAVSDDVLALSFHVDYWNYLGWKDTFSKAKFTERQKLYAVSFNRRGIYTPQVVVNGRDHVVGSRKGDIESLMNSYRASGKGLSIPISAVRSSDKVRITAEKFGGTLGTGPGEATLWIVYFDKKKSVKILRGENRGRTITYHNVVSEMSMLGMMKDGTLDVTLPLNEMKRQGAEACAIILQASTKNKTPGAILGATVIDGLDS